MFALVLLFGLFHGLVFLPVLLSLIGPQAARSSKLWNNDSPDICTKLPFPYGNNAFNNDNERNTNTNIDKNNSKISSL